jgi:hypothetical protein
LSAINIQESSPAPGPDIFNIPVGATASSITGTNLVLDQQSLTIGFQANLGSVSDLLQGVMTFGPAGSFQSISVTGSADPIGVRPIPPAVTLFGAALALFALVLHGRNRSTGMSLSSV